MQKLIQGETQIFSNESKIVISENLILAHFPKNQTVVPLLSAYYANILLIK